MASGEWPEWNGELGTGNGELGIASGQWGLDPICSKMDSGLD